MSNGVTAYDAPTYHRQKARRLERSLATARQTEERLYRLLLLALEVAHPPAPLALLRVLEDLDDAMHTPKPAPVTETELIALLNGTWKAA